MWPIAQCTWQNKRDMVKTLTSHRKIKQTEKHTVKKCNLVSNTLQTHQKEQRVLTTKIYPNLGSTLTLQVFVIVNLGLEQKLCSSQRCSVMEETQKLHVSHCPRNLHYLLSEFTQDAIYLMKKSAQISGISKSAQPASVGVRDLSISTH